MIGLAVASGIKVSMPLLPMIELSNFSVSLGRNTSSRIQVQLQYITWAVGIN